MAFLGKTYNTADYQQVNPDPVPAGWYTAKITETKVKDTKAGTGKYLEVTFSILGPSYEGRCVWGRFNLKNPNPQAEQIGNSQFMDMVRCIGLESVSDSDQLLGGEIQVKVSIKPGDGQYDDSNDVKRFKAVEGMSMLTQVKAAPSEEPAKKPATAPWLKK